jgi:hypothetical protein
MGAALHVLQMYIASSPYVNFFEFVIQRVPWVLVQFEHTVLLVEEKFLAPDSR